MHSTLDTHNPATLLAAVAHVHEVTPVDKFHDVVQTGWSLEAGMEPGQKRRATRQSKDALFCHCARNIIILDDSGLFQHLDGKYIVVTLCMDQQRSEFPISKCEGIFLAQ